MPFLNFPNEVIEEVLSYLSRSSLLSTFLVSKRLSTLSEAFLYASVELKWDPGHNTRIASLLVTVLKKPHLARKIRVVKCIGHELRFRGDDPGEPRDIIIDQQHVRTFIAHVRLYGLIIEPIWVHQLERRTMDSLLTLFLAQLHNLRELELDLNFGPYCPSLLVEMFRAAIFFPTQSRLPLPSFEHLRRVTFSLEAHPPESATYSAPDILPLLFAPRIQELQVPMHTCPAIGWHNPFPSAASSLTSLTLGYTVDCHDLGYILSITNRLKYLKWTWSPTHIRMGGWGADLDELCVSLSHVRETLTEFRIVTVESQLGIVNFGSAFNFTGSLRSLSRFHFHALQLPLPMLLNERNHGVPSIKGILPAQLETLEVVEDTLLQGAHVVIDEDVLAAFLYFLEFAEDAKLPLRHLRVRELGNYTPRDSGIWQEIDKAAENSRVGFEYNYDPDRVGSSIPLDMYW